MLKVASGNVGHYPEDLDEITGNIKDKNPCSLPHRQEGRVTFWRKKRMTSDVNVSFLAELKFKLSFCTYFNVLYGDQW